MIVADNDVATRSANYILKNFLRFKEAIWPTEVKLAGNMRRKDLDATVVSDNNISLGNNLGCYYKSTKLIQREDFHDNRRFHFEPLGQGYRHMAAMILSVLEEIVKKWLLYRYDVVLLLSTMVVSNSVLLLL